MPFRTLICLLTLCTSLAMAQDGLLLYAPFDGSPDAALAGGSAINTSPEQTYVWGRDGKALVADTDCQFATEGNFNQAEGTVAMWFRPHWEADAEVSNLSLTATPADRKITAPEK